MNGILIGALTPSFNQIPKVATISSTPLQNILLNTLNISLELLNIPLVFLRTLAAHSTDI